MALPKDDNLNPMKEAVADKSNLIDPALQPDPQPHDIVAAADPWEKYAPQAVEPEDPWAKYNPQETVTDFGDTSGRDLRGMPEEELKQQPWYSRTYSAVKEAYGSLKSFDKDEVAKFKKLFGDSEGSAMLLGTARALDIAVTTAELGYRGAQTAVYDALTGVVSDKLAKDIVSMPEAFAGSPGHFAKGKVRAAGGVNEITDVKRAAVAAKSIQTIAEDFVRSTGREATAADIAAAKFPDAKHAYPQPKVYDAAVGERSVAIPKESKFAEHGTVDVLQKKIADWKREAENNVNSDYGDGLTKKVAEAEGWLSEFLANESGSLNIFGKFVKADEAAASDAGADRMRIHTDHEVSMMIGNVPISNLPPGLTFGASELGRSVLGKEFKNSMTGSQLYEAVAKKVGPESASQLFAENGVHGIKVDGGHYIFDSRIIEPTHVAGQPIMPADAVQPPDPGLRANPTRKATDNTGNIRLDRINASEDALTVMREAAIENEGHSAARAGEVSPHAIAAASEMTGIPMNELAHHGLFNNDSVLRSVMGGMIHSATDWARRGREFIAKNDFQSLKDVVEGQLRHGYIQNVLSAKLAEAGRTLAVPKEFYNAAGELTPHAPLELPKNARKTLETLKKDKEKAAVEATKATQEAVDAERAIKDAPDKDVARKAHTVAKRKAKSATEDATAIEKEHEALAKDIERRQPRGGLKEFRDTVVDEASMEAWLKKHLGMSLDDAKKMAKDVSNMTPDQVIKRHTLKERAPKTWSDIGLDIIHNIYYNGLLSGPFTHIKYMGANEMLMQFDNVAAIPAGMWSHIRKAFGAKDVEQIYMGESMARLWASTVSIPEALMGFVHAIKEDSYVRLPSQVKYDKAGNKIGGLPDRNTLMEDAGLIKDPKLRMAAQVAAAIETSPVRVIRGIHSFHAIRAYRAEINAWAYKAAIKDGYRPWEGGSFFERVREHAENPYSDKMKGATGAAEAEAARVTHTTPLGPAGDAFSTYIQKLPFGFLLAPFTHVPANVVKNAMEMLPGTNLIDRTHRANLIGTNGPNAQANAIGRMTLGSVVGYMGVKWALSGEITGDGPPAGPERTQWLLNHKPRSIQIGDEWRSYDRMGSLSIALGIGAALAEIGHTLYNRPSAETDPDENQKHWNAAVSMGVMAIGSVINEAGLQTIGELMNAKNNPNDHTIGRVFRNEAASVVPFTSFFGQVAASQDPYVRRLDTMLDAIKNKSPLHRQELLPAYDRLGRLQPNPRYGIGHSIFPGVPVNPDPLILELQRLDIAPTPIPRHIDGVQMTPAEQNEAQATFGASVEELLTPLVNAPDWREMPDVARKQAIRDLMRQSREQSTMVMKMKYPNKFINKPLQNQIDLMDGTKKPSALYERPH